MTSPERTERLLRQLEQEGLRAPEALAAHLRDCEEEIERATTEIAVIEERRRIWQESLDRVRARRPAFTGGDKSAPRYPRNTA